MRGPSKLGVQARAAAEPYICGITLPTHKVMDSEDSLVQHFACVVTAPRYRAVISSKNSILIEISHV